MQKRQREALSDSPWIGLAAGMLEYGIVPLSRNSQRAQENAILPLNVPHVGFIQVHGGNGESANVCRILGALSTRALQSKSKY